MSRSTALFVALLAGAAATTVAGCGDEPLPVMVTYSRDIQPLMVAHCVRCHGAGGTLNADLDSTPAFGLQKPSNGYFTSLADPAAGEYGLMHYAGPNGGQLKIFVNTGPMPPPPSDQLTDREYNLLMTWSNNPLP